MLRNNERYYGFARQEYEKAGRKIIDATLDGKCQVFEKANYLGAVYTKRTELWKHRTLVKRSKMQNVPWCSVVPVHRFRCAI